MWTRFILKRAQKSARSLVGGSGTSDTGLIEDLRVSIMSVEVCISAWRIPMVLSCRRRMKRKFFNVG